MTQKILHFAKTKCFIFNAVFITVCVLTAVTIPQIVGNIKPSGDAAGQDIKHSTAANSGKENRANGGTDSIIQELGEVTSDPIIQIDPEIQREQVLKLRAVFFELVWGDKYWEITLIDGDDNIVKNWTEIFAEYETDRNILQISGDGFEITMGGIKRAAGAVGGYTVTVTYSALSVELKKTETTF
jgi:hypothetical protein